MGGNKRDTRNFRTQPPLPYRREPSARKCPVTPAKTEAGPRAASIPTVSPACRGGLQTRPRSSPQRTAYRRPAWRQRSEMSGNEREYKISAPNRHSRTGGNPTSGNVRLCPPKQNPAPGPLQEDDATTFSRLRREVDSLLRKYATELRVYRLRPLVSENHLVRTPIRVLDTLWGRSLDLPTT